jgi:type I restriction enzyme S subunit
MKQGWEIVEFEKCLDKVTYTNKIQKKDFKKEGIYPVVSQEKEFINGYWDIEDDLFRVDKPVVIFGDHTQVIKFVDFDFVLGADGVKILKPQDKIDSKYFYYFLQNVNLGSLGYARHYRLLKEINVAYPNSLLEQQRIVSIIDKCFSAIDKAKANADKNLKNAKELFESYLQGVFGSTGSPTEKKGEKWEEKKLGEVCKIFNGGTPDTKVKEYWGGDNLWITPKDMGKLNSIYVEETNRKITDSGLKNSSAKILPQNSVILSSRAPIGHLAINTKPMSTNQGCKGIIPNKRLNSLFLYYFLKNSFQLLNELGSGTTFKELSTIKLSDVKISLPSISEQQKIVKRLDALRDETQKLEVKYKKKIDNLEELKKSLLQKAFGGEL